MGHSLVEVPPFQAMVNAGELLVFSFDFGNDGMSVGFELGALFMVMVVAFDLSRCSEVHCMDHCSQCKERGSVAL